MSNKNLAALAAFFAPYPKPNPIFPVAPLSEIIHGGCGAGKKVNTSAFLMASAASTIELPEEKQDAPVAERE